MHKGEGGCLIMVDEEQYGNDGKSEKRHLLSGPDPASYLSHLSSSNYKDGRGAQGRFWKAVEVHDTPSPFHQPPTHLKTSTGGMSRIMEVVCALLKPDNC